MEKRFALYLLLSVCSLLALSCIGTQQVASASEIERWLIMPGPVVTSHAEFEADCGSCHAPLSDQPQHELCVVCHTEVGEDVAQESGFHGRLSEAQRFDCAGCHTDHEGRDMQIVEFDEGNFDHLLTDFALHGAHANVACNSCHTTGDAHREAPTECVACHRSDDVHNGSLGDDCAACHTDSDWSSSQFDHSRTRFPLDGAHIEVRCDACHMSEDFAAVGLACISCHRSDDVHKGSNGTECAECHNTSTWKDPTFDHFAMSGFGLIGGHQDVACESCHRSGNFGEPGNSKCTSCHRQDDVHKGRFGNDCGSCHNVFGWDSMHFDHKRESGFALPAGHDGLACSDCHTGSLDEALPTTCGSCHADDDVHLGQLGDRCESCHVATSWVAELWFDHDITSFPLVGEHSRLACGDCHATMAFHDADTECASCHADNDPHRGTLGAECDNCHNPTSWQAWKFDHDVRTSFPLTGSHIDLNCDACHTEQSESGSAIRGDCNSCHRRDDPHFGRFGNNCEACHTTSSFTQIEGM